MFNAEVKLLFERNLGSLYAGKKKIFSAFIVGLVLEAIAFAWLSYIGLWEFAYTKFLPCAAWAVFFLVGAVCLHQSFRIERRKMMFTGVLINPPDAAAIFIAKFAANLCIDLIFLAAILSIHLTIWENIQNIGSAILIFLGGLVAIGFASMGILVTGRTLHWKRRSILFPLVLAVAIAPQFYSVILLTMDSVRSGVVSVASVHFAIAGGYVILSLMVSWAMFDNALIRRGGIRYGPAGNWPVGQSGTRTWPPAGSQGKGSRKGNNEPQSN